MIDTKLVSHVSFKLHFSKKSLCFTFRFTCQSPSLIFTVSPPPLQLLCTPIPHTGLLPSSASRALPKNPPLNINGRHSVQVQGIHANAPPGHPIDSNAPRMEKNSRVNRFTLANITGIRTWYMMQGILQNDFYFLPPLIISNYRNIIWLGLASRE